MPPLLDARIIRACSVGGRVRPANPMSAAADRQRCARSPTARLKFSSAIDPNCSIARLRQADHRPVRHHRTAQRAEVERPKITRQVLFRDVDKTVTFAHSTAEVRGHTLVWYDSPDWVKRLPNPPQSLKRWRNTSPRP